MARVRMVTRTINVTLAEVMTVNTTTCEVSVQVYELTGENYTTDKALKELKKLYETDTTKVVAIQSIEVREEMYGMKEIDFIRYAEKLDPQTRKLLEAE